MSLTLPAAYSSAAKQGNIAENWLVQLSFFNGDGDGKGEGGWDAIIQSGGDANLTSASVANTTVDTVDVDDGRVFTAGDFIKIDAEIMRIISISTHELTVERGAMSSSASIHGNNTQVYWNNFTPIALADTKVDSVFYHGAITNKNPSIRTSFDLAKSVAKTGNIRLTVANFQYKGDDFSAELFAGTRKYINRTVKIYSQLSNATALSNCLQIYHGRLVDMSHNDSTISLFITEKQPWDYVKFPQTKTSDTNKYFPISYGNFTANSTSSDYRANKTVFPIPVNEIRGEEALYLTGVHSISSTAYPHYYDRNLDRFLPVYVDDFSNFDTANEVYKNGYAVRAYHKLPKKFFMKPVENSSSDTWTNGDNAFDTPLANETSTYTQIVLEQEDAGTERKHYNAKWLRPDHKVDTAAMTILYQWTITRADINDGSQSCFFRNETWSFNDDFNNTDNATNDETNGTTASSGLQTDASAAMVSSFDSAGGWSDDLQIEVRTAVAGADAGTCTFTPRIYDIRANVATEIDFTDKDQGYQSLKSVEYLYCGGDGLTKSYSGGSGVATTGLEAHRDLLVRFAGYDDTDANIYNWDTDDATHNYSANIASLNIESLRITTAWDIRAWFLEPIELKTALQKIQHEFAFIFKFRADGVGSYWFIKDSYSSSDVAQTLTKDDISKLNISTTPFSELVTKMEVSYEKHPAASGHLSSVTAEDTSNNPRAKLNIDAKENLQQVNLDMNVNKPGNANPGGGDPNDGFADYYMNIYGDIKKIISCDIVNSGKSYNLETGDIIQFSNTAGEMSVDPFGDNWADYYMITDLKRSPGKVSITAREVG